MPGESYCRSTHGGAFLKTTRYDVVFEGGVLPGFTAQAAREKLADISFIGPLKASGIYFDGSPMVLYSSISKPMALTASSKLKGAGLDCWIIKHSDSPVTTTSGRPARLSNYAIILMLILIAISSVALIIID